MNKAISDQDIIIIGQQPWDTEIGSNCKNIALELSKHNRVLYVNSPLDRITLWKSKNDPKVIKRKNVIRGKENGIVQVQQNLWNYYPDCMVESVNWINNHFLFDILNKINNKKFAGSISKAVKKLGFNNFILFNDNEIFKGFYLNDFLKPRLSIYYSRDYMVGVPYWRKHGLRLEPQLIAKNDICFSNSAYLADYCRNYNHNSFDVGQGCDVDDFVHVSAMIPEDLASLKGIVVGYVGSLNSERLSIPVIEHIAQNFPQFNVVLVGPEDEQFISSQLHQMSNVFFLGQKPVDQLPNYINAFDVCINPQLVNEITIGNYPRKIDEYLALGKPVVASRTKTMESFKDYVYLAQTSEDYVDLIHRAITEHNEVSKQARIDFALTHTWEQSISAMSKEINTFFKTEKSIS